MLFKGSLNARQLSKSRDILAFLKQRVLGQPQGIIRPRTGESCPEEFLAAIELLEDAPVVSSPAQAPPWHLSSDNLSCIQRPEANSVRLSERRLAALVANHRKYPNVAVTALAVITSLNDGRVLLARNTNGYWKLPERYVVAGEDYFEAGAKTTEAILQAGDLSPPAIAGVIGTYIYRYVLHIIIRPEEATLIPSRRYLSVRWFAVNDLPDFQQIVPEHRQPLECLKQGDLNRLSRIAPYKEEVVPPEAIVWARSHHEQMILAGTPQPLISTVGIVRQRDSAGVCLGYIVAQRAKGERCGYWNLPGGYPSLAENAPHAVMRETREEVGVEYRGKEMAIGFNPGFLIDVLKNLKEERIELELTDSEKPGVIRLNGYIYIVLPMRLS